MRLFEGVPSPLANRKPGEIDFWVVRENTEGEYSSIGGRMFQGTDDEMAMQQAIFTRKGVDRVMKFAFEFASKGKKKHVTSATKSNGIIHTMPFWDERFAEMKKKYPGIKADQYHIDILTAHFVRNPDWFDVVVGSNLFGDILSDLGPALTGSIGVAPSGNINPERKFPSMFEPVHGSAPDIAGKFIANPIGQIWSGAMMVRHLGYPEAAEAIERAIAASLVEGGPRTQRSRRQRRHQDGRRRHRRAGEDSLAAAGRCRRSAAPAAVAAVGACACRRDGACAGAWRGGLADGIGGRRIVAVGGEGGLACESQTRSARRRRESSSRP